MMQSRDPWAGMGAGLIGTVRRLVAAATFPNEELNLLLAVLVVLRRATACDHGPGQSLESSVC